MSIQCYATDWTVIKELRGAGTVRFNGNDFSGKDVYTRIVVYDGGTDFTTPVTIYPMLRDARISDDTFVPYAMTNRGLTETAFKLNNDFAKIYLISIRKVTAQLKI